MNIPYGESCSSSRLSVCSPFNGRIPLGLGDSTLPHNNFTNLDLGTASAEEDLIPGSPFKDAEMEVYLSLQNSKVEIGEYSRKVFIGGVSEGITLNDMYNSFSEFGSLSVDWPHRLPGDQLPKGYVFLLFQQSASVNKLLRACKPVRGKFCHEIKLFNNGEFNSRKVQVRPWRNCDRTWCSPDVKSYDKIDKRFSVFLGAVPRIVTAMEIANLFKELIGSVSFVNIEVDFETDYPKGAAKVIFTKREEYVKAVASKIITICSGESEKEMEIKPYLEDNMLCEECSSVKTRLFCAELRCLRYLCGQCWKIHHESAGLRDHKHMVKGMYYSRIAHNKYPFKCDNIGVIERPRYADHGLESPELANSDAYMCSPTNKSMFTYAASLSEYQNKSTSGVFENLHDLAGGYSCKLFVCGLRDGLTFERLKKFVSHFGSVSIEWPNQEWSPLYPKDGYAFVVFEHATSVDHFIDRCFLNTNMKTLCLLLDEHQVSQNILHVHPWRKCYGHWQNPTISSNMQKQIGTRLSVFLGGLPRTFTAEELAMEMQGRFGTVVSVHIDVDFEHGYPRGTARLIFGSFDQYRKAISESSVTMNSFGITRDVEIKPFLEDKVTCELCGVNRYRHFCCDSNCLLYLCEFCWECFHSTTDKKDHKPMIKSGPIRNHKKTQRSARLKCGEWSYQNSSSIHHSVPNVMETNIFAKYYTGVSLSNNASQIENRTFRNSSVFGDAAAVNVMTLPQKSNTYRPERFSFWNEN